MATFDIYTCLLQHLAILVRSFYSVLRTNSRLGIPIHNVRVSPELWQLCEKPRDMTVGLLWAESMNLVRPISPTIRPCSGSRVAITGFDDWRCTHPLAQPTDRRANHMINMLRRPSQVAWNLVRAYIPCMDDGLRAPHTGGYLCRVLETKCLVLLKIQSAGCYHPSPCLVGIVFIRVSADRRRVNRDLTTHGEMLAGRPLAVLSWELSAQHCCIRRRQDIAWGESQANGGIYACWQVVIATRGP